MSRSRALCVYLTIALQVNVRRRGMSLRSSRAESPWAIGITVFAAAMLTMAGGCQFFRGLANVINNEVFARLIWALASTGQTVAARS